MAHSRQIAVQIHSAWPETLNQVRVARPRVGPYGALTSNSDVFYGTFEATAIATYVFDGPFETTIFVQVTFSKLGQIGVQLYRTG